MAQSKHSVKEAVLKEICQQLGLRQHGDVGLATGEYVHFLKNLHFAFYLNTLRQIFLDSRINPWVIVCSL